MSFMKQNTTIENDFDVGYIYIVISLISLIANNFIDFKNYFTIGNHVIFMDIEIDPVQCISVVLSKVFLTI